MYDDNELSNAQDAVAAKLAEIGIALAQPATFMRTPGGPLMAQLVVIVADETSLFATAAADRSMEEQFAAIEAAEAELARNERVVMVERGRLEALVDLGQITQEDADARLAEFVTRFDQGGQG